MELNFILIIVFLIVCIISGTIIFTVSMYRKTPPNITVSYDKKKYNEALDYQNKHKDKKSFLRIIK